MFDQFAEDLPSLYPTGLRDLDGMIGGLVKQDLIVIAARASMGKTWLGCHFANYIAATQQKPVAISMNKGTLAVGFDSAQPTRKCALSGVVGVASAFAEGYIFGGYNLSKRLPVVFFSVETVKLQLTKRFLAMHSGIDSQRLIRKEIYDHEYEALVAARRSLKQLPLIIDNTPATIQNPLRMMRSVLRRIVAERGELGLVVVDYIQKLGDREAGNRAQAVGKIRGAFKDMANEFDVPLVALAQIDRGVEGQANKRPGMADVKDSGDIEQDMDLGLLLYRDEYYNPQTKDKGLMEINIAKNRNGATGTCQVAFEPTVGAFSSKG